MGSTTHDRTVSAARSIRLRSAFVPHDLEEPVRGSPTGPLAGLTAAVKDMYDIAGTRTGGGNPQWLAAQRPAKVHAGAVRRILEAGATIIGKTVCDEFFYSVSGANAHYGTPVNPRAPGRLPGGSSSGSASATAAGICDFALGSDTGGSVRIPAAHCGLYGLRPTLGRVSLSGAMAMAPSFDVAGWFAASPGVSRLVGQVLLEGTRNDSPITRAVILDDAFENADAEVAELLHSVVAAARLPERIHERAAGDRVNEWREAFRVIQGFEIWRIYGRFIETAAPGLGPGIKERIAFAATVTERAAEAARGVKALAYQRMRTLATPGTVLALPTAPSIAPSVNSDAAEQASYRARVMRLTCLAGLSGLPQVAIPAGTVSGCPVSLSFIGWPGSDEALLDLAVSLAPYCGAESVGA
jgi:amidase